MKNFHDWMTKRQIEWRKGNVSTAAYGYQNKKPYPHVLPFAVWTENLWPDLQSGDASLTHYLGKEIQHHTGVHNLLSSWVACANMYFPFRRDPESLNLVAQFLRERVDPLIEQVTGIELEWADVGDFSPAKLLGETDGRRGSGQTSPDVAFLVRARVDSRLEDGVVLVESKLTEKSFYRCSARAKKHKDGRQANPNPARCLDVRLLANNPAAVCHQRQWGRKYWNHLSPAPERFCTLKRCPAATAGYQLLRQEALANGLRAKYPFVASCVAYDERNEQLLRCMNGTGLPDLMQFGDLFRDAVTLKLFTHQQWWRFVRARGGSRWAAWARWIQGRYVFE